MTSYIPSSAKVDSSLSRIQLAPTEGQSGCLALVRFLLGTAMTMVVGLFFDLKELAAIEAARASRRNR